MPLLKHPVAGTIVNVTGARAEVLKGRGYTEVDDHTYPVEPPSAVQPQPPIDTRLDPPQPPTETRPDELFGQPPIDTRPPNPLGPVAESVAEADGAGLEREPETDDEGETQEDEPAARIQLPPDASAVDVTVIAPADADEDQAGPSVPLERPAASASKAAWVAYAAQEGVADADDLSKPAIIELLDA